MTKGLLINTRGKPTYVYYNNDVDEAIEDKDKENIEVVETLRDKKFSYMIISSRDYTKGFNKFDLLTLNACGNIYVFCYSFQDNKFIDIDYQDFTDFYYKTDDIISEENSSEARGDDDDYVYDDFVIRDD